MKILLTTDHVYQSVNGVMISALNLKKELEKSGCDVRFLCLSPTLENIKPEPDFYCIGSIPFHIYPDIRTTLPILNPLVDELIQWKPDIIHSQCEFITYTIVQHIAKRCHTPIIHTYHTLYEYYVNYLFPIGDWKKAVAPVMRTRLRTADVVIAPTAKTAEGLRKGRIAEEIRIIPTGIDLSKYEKVYSAEEKKAILSRLQIPEGALIYGSVGRLAAEKNLSEVLHAHARLLKSGVTAYLVLTGDGADRARLEKEARNLGILPYVKFPGMVAPKDVGAYYQILRFFISASVSETQGLTYIEALANNIPVLARKDSALLGVLEHGKNGYQYTNVEELDHYIHELLEDDATYEKLVEGARASREKFGTKLFGKRVLSLYQEVLSRGTEPRWKQKRLGKQVLRRMKVRSDSSDYGRFYATLESKLRRTLFERAQRRQKNQRQGKE